MDEAISTELGGDPIGIGKALLLFDSGQITDLHRFRCPDRLCQAPVLLKAPKSATYEPHYASCSAEECLGQHGKTRAPTNANSTDQYHHDECEYRSGKRHAGAKVGGRLLVAGDDIVLQSGLLIKVSGSAAAPGSAVACGGTGAPRNAYKTKSNMTLRALVDYTRVWEPIDFRNRELLVAGERRLTSHLFLCAEWLPDFEVRAGDVRWPRFMGPVKYFNASSIPHIVFGSATLRSNADSALPTLVWETRTDVPVVTVLDEKTFARSKFKRRFVDDLERVGWSAGKDVRCLAFVLGTVTAAGTGANRRLSVTPAGSFEDVFLIPESSMDLAKLRAALASFYERHAKFVTTRVPAAPPLPPPSVVTVPLRLGSPVTAKPAHRVHQPLPPPPSYAADQRARYSPVSQHANPRTTKKREDYDRANDGFNVFALAAIAAAAVAAVALAIRFLLAG
jgi:hypothetical protein